MEQHRYFDVFTERMMGFSPSPGAMFQNTLSSRKFGCCLVFVSNSELRDPTFQGLLSEIGATAATRVMLVLLESIDWEDLRRVILFMSYFAPEYWSLYKKLIVPIYLEGQSGINWNKVDDLIVRIYHMIYLDPDRKLSLEEFVSRV
jgi:hypothetical protein